MDALLVGTLAALGTIVGMLYWVLLVRPASLLGLWGDSWDDDEADTVSALRMIGGAFVLLVGFCTGLAVAFLAATSA